MAKHKLLKAIFGTKQEHDLKKLLSLLHQVNEMEHWAVGLTKEAVLQESGKLRELASGGADLNSLLPQAFALAREAARRVLGERLYDVQLLGAMVLHQGKIMEMKTGEGKTVSCVPAAYLNALTGKGVHIVTVNDYLAERDSQWMGPVYEYLGLKVGVILSSLDNEARRHAYSCDITYGTNNEFGFDYLRDNMKWDISQKIQPKHSYAIVDEIDSILIDEARTPLIISGSAEDDTKKFFEVNRLVNQLKDSSRDPDTGNYPDEPDGDYTIDEKSKKVAFTTRGMNTMENLLLQERIITGSLFDEENFDYVHYFTQSLKAHKLYARDTDYVVADGQVGIVDEFTGRILHGRRYSDGLHQAIEAKERITIAKRNRTLATITFQNFFRMYDKLSGMTGTADTEASEFSNIYKLEVVVIPTNRPVVRQDNQDLIYYNEQMKYEAICNEIAEVTKRGQPVLVGTVSIEKSEQLARMLQGRGIRHEVLNAKNHAREALIIAEAGAQGSVTIATNMAGRGTDIKLGGNPEYRAMRKCGTDASPEEYLKAVEQERIRWKQDYEEVREAGGLYILGTERHESRRIDNQLRGRSGRQGDPGYSRFFLSLDDTLMRLFAKENLKGFMGKLGMSSGDPIQHSLITRTIEKAQSRVEERNFEIRKHLLEFDDVLNEQRTFIYRQRDEILSDTNLTSRIRSSLRDMVEGMVDDARKTNPTHDALLDTVGERLKEELHLDCSAALERVKPAEVRSLPDAIAEFLESHMEEKISFAGKEAFNTFIRYHYLRQIDSRWQEHLEQMEALREAVYLRTYSQKNPLLEYKLEGFDIFESMLEEIRYSIARVAVRVRITGRKESPARRAEDSIRADHREMGQFGVQQMLPKAAGSENQQVQVRRTAPKVGRNDPCPCGSGKKYKHCCGR